MFSYQLQTPHKGVIRPELACFCLCGIWAPENTLITRTHNVHVP